MACQICYVELPTEKMIKLSCGCLYCKICLNIWITSQLDHYVAQSLIIRCPNGNPPHFLSEDEVKASLSDSELNHYQLLILRRILMQQDEYKICPAKKCNYIGWTDKKCPNQLICEQCETKWIDPSLKGNTLGLFENCYKLITGKEIDILSDIWKDTWTKKCPKCSYSIEKNGGCNHMKCENCHYEFCWICMNEYNNHIQKMCYNHFLTIFMIFFSWMMAFLAIKLMHSSDILW